MPRKEEFVKLHIGEEHISKAGQVMTIIGGRTGKDMDVRFSGGTVRGHIRYSTIVSGEVKNPNLPDARRVRNKARIGEKKMMKCGMSAEIVEYRSCSDVDVRFPDGSIAAHKSYTSFLSGSISHPVKGGAYEAKFRKHRDERIGMKIKANCGLMAEITDCPDPDNVKVRFENGYETTTRYESFVKGSIKCPGTILHTGEKKVMKNGLMAEVTAYRAYNDIDVRFENGIERHGIHYSEFSKGEVALKAQKPISDSIGKTYRATCGLLCTLISSSSTNDCTVRFEDGTIREHVSFSSVKAGSIKHPTLSAIKDGEFCGYYTHRAYRNETGVWYKVIDKKTGEKDIMTPQMMIESRKT